jgi:asparagine synthase (glutamine-hydrolysing)
LHSSLIEGKQFETAALELRRLVTEATVDLQGDSILLSGGLDTSIIASIATKLGLKLHALTVLLKDVVAPDSSYSKLVCSRLGISQHETIVADLEDIENSLPEVIGILRTFDPMEIRNSITIYLGLNKAASEGLHRVYTGDGADELFAGYSFVTNLTPEQAIAKLRHLWQVMHFSSIPLASSKGIEALLPFLEPKVREFAEYRVPYEFLVDNDKDGNLAGKYILRRAFESDLPPEIVWRRKTPIEFGSGTTVLPQIYSQKISDNEFQAKRTEFLEHDRVRIRDKEQLHYYEIYRGIFGPIDSDLSRRFCPACNSNVADNQNFCTICGEFPI